jgi:hypothetical protein
MNHEYRLGDGFFFWNGLGDGNYTGDTINNILSEWIVHIVA